MADAHFTGYVYVVLNRTTGKRYVGQTALTVQREWRNHVYNATCGRDNCRLLYRAIRKHGAAAFVIECVRAVPVAGLDAAEREVITARNARDPRCGYNVREGGSCGRHHQQTKERMRNAALGRRHTPEARAKMSMAKRGVAPANKGIPLSNDARNRLRQAKLGHSLSAAHRASISAALMGRPSANRGRKRPPFSSEWLASMSRAQKGRRKSAAHVAAMSAARRGRTTPPDVRARMSASQQVRRQKEAALGGPRKRTPEQCANIMAGRFAAAARRKALAAGGTLFE